MKSHAVFCLLAALLTGSFGSALESTEGLRRGQIVMVRRASSEHGSREKVTDIANGLIQTTLNSGKDYLPPQEVEVFQENPSVLLEDGEELVRNEKVMFINRDHGTLETVTNIANGLVLTTFAFGEDYYPPSHMQHYKQALSLTLADGSVLTVGAKIMVRWESFFDPGTTVETVKDIANGLVQTATTRFFGRDQYVNPKYIQAYRAE